jgi:hypothetical protein
MHRGGGLKPETFGLEAVAGQILRNDYGSRGQFGFQGAVVPASHSLGALLASLGRTFLWLPLALGFGALGCWMAVRTGSGEAIQGFGDKG